ncbi:ythi like protein [Bacillus sp. OxB-1]|uniref:class I SAM-dependent methyltransferase n=1 Tax=Bacillus sp. (strain OxB-1) TaxID=98228 RepID=UPI000581EA75|nr:class I SAM-dependent methyltransferase [Bacillus sp. OxB-1]BAQ11754.1 ythi like protein [Bacillus sp. OxB-1]
MTTNTEKIFAYLDTYAESSEDVYLEAIKQACEKWLSGADGPGVTEPVRKEEIRRGIQLAILKGMKQDVQPHHQMTPDSIGMLMGHMAGRLLQGQKNTKILDPAAGTGNLLYTVMDAIGAGVAATAVEIDDLLVRLAAVTAELLEHPVSFYVQDALRPLLVDPVDMVVSDLPVGYYPDDDNALNFELMPSEGHAYAHHLFIEQSMNHLKPGGYALFVIPANLFDTAQASDLHPFLKQKTVILAVIQLPSTLFKHAVHEKSILVLQKPDPERQRTSDVLLAKVPNMTDAKAMSLFLQKIDSWVDEEEVR